MQTLPSSTRPRRLGLLYGAETLTGLGDGVFWVGLIVAISGSSSFNALLTAAVVVRLAPRALFSLPAGSLVDLTNVRKVLVATDLARAVVMMSLAIAVAGGMSMPWVMPGVLVAYLIGVPWRPALSTALPSVASERQLAHANAVISAIRQTMTFLGPLAGVVIADWSVSAAFLLNGCTFALSALCVMSVRGVRWPAGVPRRERRAVAASGRPRPRRADGFGSLIALTTLMYFVRGAEMVLHVLVVRDLIGTVPSAIGYLGGAIGLGAVVVTPIARRLAADDAALGPIVASVALTAIPSAVLAAVDQLTVAALLVVPVGAGMVLFEVITVVTVQRTSPPLGLGRAFGALNAASNTGKLVGAVTAPLMVSAFGLVDALVIVAGVVAAGGLACFIPLRRVSRRAERRRSDLAPMVARLADLDLLRGASQLGLERLAEHAIDEEVEPGHVLLRQGDPADDLFVVLSGDYDVTVDGTLVNRIGPGDWAGEIGLVEEVPRTASVQAVSPSTVWRIPGDVFLTVFADVDDASTPDGDLARPRPPRRWSRINRRT